MWVFETMRVSVWAKHVSKVLGKDVSEGHGKHVSESLASVSGGVRFLASMLVRVLASTVCE